MISIKWLDVGGLALLISANGFAQDNTHFSVDTRVSAELGAANIAIVTGDSTQILDLGALPATSNIDAYSRAADGSDWFSLDSTTLLDGTIYAPNDVIRHENGSYEKRFDGRAEGLPATSNITAIANVDNELTIALESTVLLGGTVYRPTDLIGFDGTRFEQRLSTNAPLPAAIRIDAAELHTDGRWLLSFDSHGMIGTVRFTAADVIAFDPTENSWTNILQGAAATPSLVAANINAVSVPRETRARIFADQFEALPNATRATQ